MKNLKILLTLFTVICFAGCSNDDSENKTNTIPQELIGKWKATYYEDDVIDVDQNGNPIIHYLSNQYTLELKSNGTFTSNEFTNFSSGTYSIINSGGTYNHLKFIFTNDDGSQLINYKIFVEANNSSMTLSISLENAYPMSVNNFPREVFFKVE